MTVKELETANLANLMSLWRAMGARSLEPQGLADTYASRSWPHRWWLDPACDLDRLDGDTDRIERFVDRIEPGGIVPLWFHDRGCMQRLERRLGDAGFEHVMDQTAMALDLSASSAGWDADAPQPADSALDLLHPRDTETLERWSRLCGEAFGYRIDPAVIATLAGNPDVSLLMARAAGEDIGTGLVWYAQGVAGIHQVAVPHRLRGRGIARALMLDILDRCRRSGTRWVTLQASAAGAGIYRALGFADQFRIRLYRRPGV